MKDWHVHTKYSDGEHSPSKVVQISAEAGLEELAITDHDTIDGIEEALEAGKSLGINIIQGIEFSVDQNTSHILGYGINHETMANDFEYQEITTNIREAKRARAKKMCKKSQEEPIVMEDKNGNNYEVSLTIQDMDKLVHGRAIYTGHFGVKIAEKVKENLGVTIDQYEATMLFFKASKYDKYATKTISEIDPCYNPEKVDGEKTLLDYVRIEQGKKNWQVKEDKTAYPTAFQAIFLIHNHGGIAIIAHPDEGTTRERVEKYLQLGADGIEVYSPKNNGGTPYYQRLVEKYNLIATAGTDWHGQTYSPNKRLGMTNAPTQLN